MNRGRMLVTGRIHAMDRPAGAFDWMLVESGKVAARGRGAPPDDVELGSSVLDLTANTILPVLHDAHVHFLQTGLMELDLDLGGAATFGEMIALVADAAAGCDRRMLRAHSFDPDLMKDGRYPTTAELDAAAPGLPVLIKRRDGHSGAVNSAAWGLLEISECYDGVERDGAGNATGVLREDAYTHAVRRAESFISREERLECFRIAASAAVRRGIGVVHALAGSKEPDDRDVELLLGIQDELPIDTVIYSQMEDVDRVASLGLPRIGGCLLLDGSFSSGTAALAEPYADREGTGVLYYDDDHLTDFFRAAHARGMQISVHALGERAIGQALRCYREACGDGIAAMRHRIEHCELPREAHMAAMADSGISPCVQPTFEFLWGGAGGMIEKRLGPDRAARTNPHRTMLASGIPLGAGSDSYVTPMDSMLGIHSAVNRPNESERLSVFDAVALFTSGSARLSFDEDTRGTLEPGKDASFTVLAEDPFEVDPGVIRDIEVEGLYLKGERVASD